MMEKEIYVAGAGVITGIGNNVRESIASFENGAPGMAEIKYLETSHAGRLPVAEVKLDDAALVQTARQAIDRLALPRDTKNFSSHTPRTALLSVIAAAEALHDAGVRGLDRRRLKCGFISATTVGGLNKTEDFYKSFSFDRNAGRMRDVILHECGAVTEWAACRLAIDGYSTTVSTACSSSANSIALAARMISAGMLDMAVAGGTDALTLFTLNGFNTLMILDEKLCRPFDQERAGLNLGEGAGYLVLVSAEMAKKMQVDTYCKLSGYANANDAYHQTASSPDGTGSFLAMRGALEMAGIRPENVDYINLHGTGTQNNDQSEGVAIKRLFGEKLPMLSSTKSFTGHTLGAAGGVEAVFSALSVRDGMVYPNLRFTEAMEDLNIVPFGEFKRGLPIRNVLSNSFGFGGNCSSLLFSGN